MCHPGAANLFRKMPTNPNTVVHQFFFSVMPPDVLQVAHYCSYFPPIRSPVNNIVQHSLFAPIKCGRLLPFPSHYLLVSLERDRVPACAKNSAREISFSAPVKL